MEKITSISNAKIQEIKKLLSSKADRYQSGKFIAEGVNIVKDIPDGFILALFMTENTFQKYQNIAKKNKNIYLVSDKVMGAISDTKSPSGVVAVCCMPQESDLKCDKCIVLDNLQDPGNAGTIIRTAVACGVHLIYCYGDCVDLYSPKVVRSSMGGIFFVNIKKLQSKSDLSVPLFVLDMAGENLFKLADKPSKFALLVGNESRGVSKEMKEQADNLISLPMNGNMESLNASVSLSIALYQLING